MALGDVVAILPALAAETLKDAAVEAVPLPFLNGLARNVVLAWNRQHAEVRPQLTLVGRILSDAWRLTDVPPVGTVEASGSRRRLKNS